MADSDYDALQQFMAFLGNSSDGNSSAGPRRTVTAPPRPAPGAGFDLGGGEPGLLGNEGLFKRNGPIQLTGDEPDFSPDLEQAALGDVFSQPQPQPSRLGVAGTAPPSIAPTGFRGPAAASAPPPGGGGGSLLSRMMPRGGAGMTSATPPLAEATPPTDFAMPMPGGTPPSQMGQRPPGAPQLTGGPPVSGPPPGAPPPKPFLNTQTNLGLPVPGAPRTGGYTPPAAAGGGAPPPSGGVPLPGPATPPSGGAPPTAPPAGPRARGEEAWQTYEKATGKKWGGGGSDQVQQLIRQLQIGGKAGSAEQNLALQKALRDPAIMQALQERMVNTVNGAPAPIGAPPPTGGALTPEEWLALQGSSR